MTPRWLVLWLAVAAALPAQSRGPVEDLAPGRFLVAHRNLGDPNFARTVVLLATFGEEGAMGLIVNRQTKLPLSKVLGDLKAAKDRTDRVYFGGPVSITGVLALARSRPRPEDARHVFADVHLISSKPLLEKTLAAGAQAGALRVYLGYSGWAPGQLEAEVELGSWYIFRADAGMVFDPEPDTVWSRLMGRTEVRIALGPRRPGREALR